MSSLQTQQDFSGPLLPSVAFDSNNPAPSTTTAADAVGSPLKKARSSISGLGDEDMRKRFGLFGNTPTAPGKRESAGLGLSGVQADVLGNIEHDRMAHAGTHPEDEGTQRASLGGLLGDILGNGGNGGNVGPTGDTKAQTALSSMLAGEVKGEPTQQVERDFKMEEEEEL